VLLPVAAVGLWMQVSWGPVLWVVAAGAEVIMHQGLPQYFGERPLLIAAHAVVSCISVFRDAVPKMAQGCAAEGNN
jgi:hypothetical protein